MTQPEVTPPIEATAEVVPEPPAPPAVIAATPPQKIDPAAFMKEIEEATGIDVADLPRGAHFMWGWSSGATGGGLLLSVRQPWPFEKTGAMTIIAMFHHETDVHVYALANRPPAKGEALHPTRYRVSKTGPNVFAEVMSLEIFKEVLGREFEELDEETFGEDDDDEEGADKPAA